MGTKTDALGHLIISEPQEELPVVVLFHPDAVTRQAWDRAIGARCRVIEVADLGELDAACARADFVVVGDWREGLSERVNRAGRLRVIHCGTQVGDAILDATDKGIALVHVDRADELSAKILQLTFPRSVMERHAVKGLSLSWATAEAPSELAEVSNDGFSFFLDATEQGVDPTLPGAVLEEVEFLREDTVALDGVTAVVRHVAVEDDPEGRFRYRIGCEVQRRASAGAARAMTYIRDRALCAGLLRSGLRTGGLLLERADGEGEGVFAPSGHVDTRAGQLVVPHTVHALREHDVVRGRFELGGSVYRFTSSIMGRLPLMVSLPSALEVSQHRGSGRYRPPVTEPVVVDLSSALLGETVQREVRDVSSTGCSLDIDPHIDLFPVGMRFQSIRLCIGGREFRCRGVVRNLSRMTGRDQGLRCGVSFEGLGEGEKLELTDVIMRCRFPGLEDGRALSFDQLWAFFLETGFLYPAKQEALRPLLPEIRRTIEALNSRPSAVWKSVIAREGPRVIGQVSGVRAYRRTWMSQHLAAVQGRQAGALLNLGQAEYFGQTTDLEYFKIFFRPDNRWPARVFGGFARTVTDERLSDLRTYDYFQLPIDWSAPAPAGLEVIEAAGEDLSVVERHFVRTERGVLLRADDLTRGGLTLSALNASYRRMGLQRRRRVLLALRRNQPVGFALAELSSPGLNLSELLSSFRIHILPEGEHDSLLVRAALLNAVVPLYRAAGRPTAVGLALAPERREYEQLGIGIGQKQYCAWTCHRALYQRFCEHVDRLVRALMARAARSRSTERPQG